MSAEMQAPSTTERTGLSLLRADHHRLDRQLRDYALLDGSAASADRQGLISRVGACLKSLITLKEEMLYPRLEPQVGSALIAALRSDHHRMERGLHALAAGDGDDVATDLQMAQLAEVVRAHIALEEDRLFPTAVAIDSADLAEAMALRRAELLGEQGPD